MPGTLWVVRDQCASCKLPLMGRTNCVNYCCCAVTYNDLRRSGDMKDQRVMRDALGPAHVCAVENSGRPAKWSRCCFTYSRILAPGLYRMRALGVRYSKPGTQTNTTEKMSFSAR